MAGTLQPYPRMKGHNSLAVQADAVHERIHQERDAGQVADILQKSQADQKGQQVRQHNRQPAGNTLDGAGNNLRQQAA